ncbi:class I SAM-dependent methyltransferase [soil metagenome]
MALDNHQRLQESRQVWDQAAATFDEAPDHGLRDPVVRQAWRDKFVHWLPATPAVILDIGCGTGSLSLLLAELGHVVTGIDLSPAMIARAEAKARAAAQQITFAVMDGVEPELAPQQFGIIVCRHILWTLPEPDAVLQRWTNMLAAGGRLVLIEGYWHTNAGLHAPEILDALPASLTRRQVEQLSNQPSLWGGEVTDERYAVIADL